MHARSVLNEHSKYACDLTHLWKSRSQTLGLAHKGGSVVKVWPVTMAISTLHRRSKSNTGSCRLNLQRAMRLTAGSRMTKIHLNAARHAGKPEAASRSDQSAEALMQCDLSEWLQPGSVQFVDGNALQEDKSRKNALNASENRWEGLTFTTRFTVRL